MSDLKEMFQLFQLQGTPQKEKETTLHEIKKVYKSDPIEVEQELFFLGDLVTLKDGKIYLATYEDEDKDLYAIESYDRITNKVKLVKCE